MFDGPRDNLEYGVRRLLINSETLCCLSETPEKYLWVHRRPSIVMCLGCLFITLLIDFNNIVTIFGLCVPIPIESCFWQEYFGFHGS